MINPITRSITITPLVQIAGAYASGDYIGDTNLVNILADFVERSGSGGVIHSVVVADRAAQNAPMDLVFFRTDPSNTTFADDAALDINDTDLFEIIGIIPIAAADYHAFANKSVASVEGIGLAVRGTNDNGNLYMAIVCRGTPTYVAVTDLQIILTILPDQG